MNRHDVLALLEAVRAGALAPQSALERLSTMPYEDAGFARIDHHRGLIIAIGALIAMLIAWVALSATPVGLYDIGSLISSAATLALVAIGQTIVVLSGGFDLSASAVLGLRIGSLTNGRPIRPG